MNECVEERKIIEKSWDEQREYVYAAEKILNIKPDYDTTEPRVDGFVSKPVIEDDKYEISWQVFDNTDYERYKKEYMRINEATVGWALWDFTKIGLPDYSGNVYKAKPTAVFENNGTKILKLQFEKDIEEKYGLPYFYMTINDSYLEIKWFNKKGSRLPQACWLKIKGYEEKWELNKLGEWIRPSEIIGSPLISAVEKGVRNKDVVIEPIDSALVAPYGKMLLHYNEKNLKEDLYFNLYNNIWNTNFPMWYSDDALFRFRIKER